MQICQKRLNKITFYILLNDYVFFVVISQINLINQIITLLIKVKFFILKKRVEK